MEHPVYGSRKLAVRLRREGLVINRKRVVPLLRLMGIEAIYAKPKTSLPTPGHQIYPYLLRDLVVRGPDQVWCADITYMPCPEGSQRPTSMVAKKTPRCHAFPWRPAAWRGRGL